MSSIYELLRACADELHGLSRSSGSMAACLLILAPMAALIFSALGIQDSFKSESDEREFDGTVAKFIQRLARSRVLLGAAFVVLAACALWFVFWLAVCVLHMVDHGGREPPAGGRNGGGWLLGPVAGLGTVFWNVVLVVRLCGRVRTP